MIVMEEEPGNSAMAQVLATPELLERILSFLSPEDLLRCGLLVCRQWRAVVEVPTFWAWSLVRLDRNNFQEIFASSRFRLVSGCWLSYPLLTSQQITKLLQWVGGGDESDKGDGVDGGDGGGSLTYLELCGDLSEVRAEVLSLTVTGELECLDLIPARVSPAQLSLLLARLETSQPARLRLRELRLSRQSDLARLEPPGLITALLRLERLSLAGARMTGEQVRTLLSGIAGAGAGLSLREINLDDLNLSSVSPRVLAGAVLRLEVVSLNGTNLTDHQLTVLFTELATRDRLSLRELYIQRGHYQYHHQHQRGLRFIENTLLEKVKSKLQSWLW